MSREWPTGWGKGYAPSRGNSKWPGIPEEVSASCKTGEAEKIRDSAVPLRGIDFFARQ